MRRGQKRPQKEILTEQLAKAKDRLEKAQNIVKESKEEIKSLEKQLKEIEMDELKELMEQNNVSVEDLRGMLNKPE